MGTFWKDSYSAQIDMYLLIAGTQLPVAQVGPTELILQDPRLLPANSQGELVIVVDGRSILYPIHIPNGSSATSAVVYFEDLPSAPIISPDHRQSTDIKQRLLPLVG